MQQDCSYAEIQIFRIGEVEIVALPGEIFVEYGLEIKKKSHSNQCLIFGNSNSYIGYVPLKESFEQGAYETRFALSSRLVPEAGQMIVKTVNSLRQQMRKNLCEK